MTTTAINTGLPTLLDQAKRTDPDGSIANIVEVLQANNPILEDAVFLEGNLPTGHRLTSRLALPGIGWRRFNEGTAATKSRTDQIDEACGMMSGMSVVDCDLAKLNGNEAAFRASEDSAFVQAMNKEFADGLFYHSTKTTPEKFMGLSPRFGLTTDPGGGQIYLPNSLWTVSGSEQSSVWFVSWSPDTVFCIYPKGSKAGIEVNDMGEQLWTDGGGSNKFRAYVTEMNWKVGLCVKDWRYVARLPNIDSSTLAATGSTLIQAMVHTYYKMQDVTKGRTAIYCNRFVGKYLHLQALDNTKNGTLTIETLGGKPVTMFLGLPIRICDSLLTTEDVVA